MSINDEIETWERIHATVYGHMACNLCSNAGLDWVCETALKRLDELRNDQREAIIPEGDS